MYRPGTFREWFDIGNTGSQPFVVYSAIICSYYLRQYVPCAHVIEYQQIWGSLELPRVRLSCRLGTAFYASGVLTVLSRSEEWLTAR